MLAVKAMVRVAVLLAALAICAPAAQAAYPGANGRIAFVSAGEIWTVNPDGTAPQQLTSPTPPLFDTSPSWSPDGTRIAFSRGSSPARDLYLVNADGTGESLLTTNGRNPTWSPNGTEIAFLSQDTDPGLFRINSDGTNRRLEAHISTETECCAEEPAWSPLHPSIAFGWTETAQVCDPFDSFECEWVERQRLGRRWLGFPNDFDFDHLVGGGSDPDWSPSGLEFTYVTARVRVDYYTYSGVPGDIAAVSVDGSSGRRTIVGGSETDEQPAWSPDGTKVVFRRTTGTATGLWVVGADGSNPTRILELGTEPDWQPLQRPYPRPIATGPHYTSLVTAFEACTTPNRTHGPPLAHPSCNPPREASPNLVVSVGESRLRSAGFVRFKSIVGPPGAPDDSDIRMRLSITNVMNRSDASDYTGILRPEVVVRLTDRDGFQRQTTQDFPFGFNVPCAATTSTTEGGTCDLATSADSIVPGSVPEGTRAIWALDQVKVYDGGPAGDGADASLFAVQGIFIP